MHSNTSQAPRNLKVLASRSRPPVTQVEQSILPVSEEQRAAIESLQKLLCEKVAVAANLAVTQIDDVDQPVAMYGLKSIAIVQLSTELSGKLNRTLPPTLMFDYPTIREVCHFLIAGQAPSSRVSSSPSKRDWTKSPSRLLALHAVCPAGIR